MSRKNLSKPVFSVIIIGMEMTMRVIVVMMLLVVLGVAAPVLAKGKVTKGKVIEIKDALVVQGKVVKPRVWYVLEKARIKYHGIPLREDFLKRIEKPLQEDRF